MNWYTMKTEFKKKFPDWTVKIEPPCISDTRYTHYYYEVLAYALGKKTSSYAGHILKDTEHKTFTLYR